MTKPSNRYSMVVQLLTGLRQQVRFFGIAVFTAGHILQFDQIAVVSRQ